MNSQRYLSTTEKPKRFEYQREYPIVKGEDWIPSPTTEEQVVEEQYSVTDLGDSIRHWKDYEWD